MDSKPDDTLNRVYAFIIKTIVFFVLFVNAGLFGVLLFVALQGVIAAQVRRARREGDPSVAASPLPTK